MTETNSISQSIEDHALEMVPASDRQGWLQLSWNTVGIVTTLIQLFIGALTTFVAGMQIALLGGFIVMVIGALLGWGVGHIAYKTGLSSTVMSRIHGFGKTGSMITAIIFGFMIIGFIALENVLLYKGLLFYFGVADSLQMQILIYGLLSLSWILLTAFGFSLVTKVSSWLVVLFLAVLVYIMFGVVASSTYTMKDVASFTSQFPVEVLTAMHAATWGEKLAFCVNILIGSAGALALIDGDLGRYARTSKDVGIAALLGNAFMDIGMLFIGGAVMYAGMSELVAYYVNTGMTQEAAQKMALESPDSVAAAFIVFGGVLGALLMLLAQAKAQVLNTYSASLSLTNLMDAAINWRPGRLVFVILANVIAILMLVGSILEWFNSFITILGILTTCISGIIISDYFIVHPKLTQAQLKFNQTESFNWAGIFVCAAGFVLAHYVLNTMIKIEFFPALIFSVIAYPPLRLMSLKKYS
jgi:cytosine permease